MKSYITTKLSPPWEKRMQFGAPSQKAAVWGAVKDSGEDGATREDIVKRLQKSGGAGKDLDRNRVGFYLSELKRAGFIAVKGAAPNVAQMNAKEALLHAIDQLEIALTKGVKEKRIPITPEIEKQYAIYNKCKALMLRPQTSGEETAAMRQTLQRLIQMVVV